MSFQNSFPRKFSSASILSFAPAASGVYGISNGREWILIGATDNIQGKLLEHMAATDTLLHQRSPTGFSYEICDPGARESRHGNLVLEYQPICNRKPSTLRASS